MTSSALLFVLSLCYIGHTTSDVGRTCSVLRCTNESSEVFFSLGLRTDGVGATIHHLLNAGAYAHYRGWNIGYYHFPRWLKDPWVSHNVSKRRALDYLFGSSARFEPPLGRIESPLGAAPRIECDNMSAVHTFSGRGPVHVVLRDHRVPLPAAAIDSYYTPYFLNALRCDLYPRINEYQRRNAAASKDSIVVAAHIRAGDLVADRHSVSRRSSRVQSLESYFSVFLEIRKLYPNAVFEAYTSTVKPNSEYDQMLKAEFQSRGISIRIDSEMGNVDQVTDTTLDAFSQFIRADILIMAKSSFSHVAGFYNPNCVIFEEYTGSFKLFWERALSDRWIPLRNASFAVENGRRLRQRLPECMDRRPEAFCSDNSK